MLVAPIIPTSGLILTKTTPDLLVQRGGVVPYLITVQNTNVAVVSSVDIVDTLPPNFVYVAGSATINGAPVSAVVSGRRVTFPAVTVPPLSTLTLTMSARVLTGAAAGSHRNVVDVYDPATGLQLAQQASATVRIAPEPVFDCGDVIGKVFDDRNMNGYQDGPHGEDLGAISNQTYEGGKYDVAPAVIAGGEPGLAHVRLATVSGTIITTDEYGRYHVPCAELPAGIGSNFTLKLDERSLPTGYRVTTENPRVVRLTAGRVTKLNFGAAIANVVDIDLTAQAFVTATTDPTAGLLAGIDRLVSQLVDIPSVLRLTYYMNGEGRDIARARLDGVEALIRDRWEQAGRYRLLIERTIRQVQ